MNTYNPLVSVTVITYNSEPYVLDALDSVKNQTYQNIELIISDDCSTDNTLSVCRNWIVENRDRFIDARIITSQVNTGLPANKNRAIKAAKGEWLKGVAGDDALIDDCVEKLIKFARQDKDIQFIYAKCIKFKDKFENKYIIPEDLPAKYFFNNSCSAEQQFQILLRFNPISMLTSIFKMTVFEKVGFYDESIRYWDDRPMLLKITSNNIKLYFMDDFTAKYRIRSNSIVRKMESRFINNFALEKANYFKANYLTFLTKKEKIVDVYQIYLLRFTHGLSLKYEKINDGIMKKLIRYLIKKINKHRTNILISRNLLYEKKLNRLQIASNNRSDF